MPQSEGYVTGEGTPRTVELAAGTEPRLGITVVQAAAGGLILNTPIPVTDNLGSLTVDDGGAALSVDDGGGNLSIDDGGELRQQRRAGEWAGGWDV